MLLKEISVELAHWVFLCHEEILRECSAVLLLKGLCKADLLGGEGWALSQDSPVLEQLIPFKCRPNDFLLTNDTLQYLCSLSWWVSLDFFLWGNQILGCEAYNKELRTAFEQCAHEDHSWFPQGTNSDGQPHEWIYENSVIHSYMKILC